MIKDVDAKNKNWTLYYLHGIDEGIDKFKKDRNHWYLDGQYTGAAR